jgi:branched-subunit amino acid transport protein
MWAAILVAGVGCYLLKLAGISVPRRLLDHPRVRHIATLLPIALLSALIVLQAFSTGHRLAFDARAAGIGAAVLAILLRAPFLAVIVVACAATALVRLAT